MRVDFEENNHVYSVNGNIANISVTELLAKHGLAPKYAGVSKRVLEERARIGKEVHKDLENIVNDTKHVPETEQGKQFKQWVDMNLDCGVAEQRIGFEKDGWSIAGTIDLIGLDKENRRIIADHKNTSKFHREYVSWQVSLYDYFARRLKDEKINSKWLNWTGAKKFYCFHYNSKTAEMKVYELDKVPDEEIEKLLDCELRGEKYQRSQLFVEKDLQDKFIIAEQVLVEKENEYKLAKSNAENLREQLLKEFEKQGIMSWESPNGKVKVTYVPKMERVVVDAVRLKRIYPLVYTDCVKTSAVKSQIRIKIKGENYEEK